LCLSFIASFTLASTEGTLKNSSHKNPPIKVTIIGDYNYAPYSYVEDGKTKGLYPLILNQIFSRMKDYQVNLSMMPWKRGLAMIENNVSLGIFPPYFWPLKRPYITRYSEPIFLEKVIAVCNKEVLIESRTHWPTDFKGLTIGNNRGFLSPGLAFFELVKKQKITLVETNNSEIGLRMLLLKRIDCYVNSQLTIDWFLNKMRRRDIYKFLNNDFSEPIVISSQNAYLGYTKRNIQSFPYSDDFEKKVNNILVQMKKQGEIQEILKRFINQP
jgi:polar amino acid transport system substrate-binding protein